MLTDTSILGTAPYRWGQGGSLALGNGVGNIVYTGSISLADADQASVGILVTGGTSAILRLRFSADGTTFFDETMLDSPTVVGGVQRFPTYVQEWGPIAPAATGLILYVPVCWHFMRIGIYGTGVPAGADFVQAFVERQRAGQLQRP